MRIAYVARVSFLHRPARIAILHMIIILLNDNYI